jgi:hypothetical protein
VKFYLTASLEARARRRQAELAAAGTPVELAAITSELATRDRQDETRELAPLRKPPGAIELDTSDLSANEVVERLLAAIQHPKDVADAPAWNRFYAFMRFLAVALMRLLFRLGRSGARTFPSAGLYYWCRITRACSTRR